MKLPNPFPAPFSLPMIRGSFSILNIYPSSTSFIANNSCLRSSASGYILRNLYILKSLPFLPTRICEKKIGPGDLIHINGAKITVKIPVKRQPTKPPTISMRRLANASRRFNIDGVIVTTVNSPNFSTIRFCIGKSYCEPTQI